MVLTQTDADTNRLHCGSGWDLGLNEVGIEQAREAAIPLKKNPFKIKRMISSPELRAVQMADIIHDQMKVKWVLWRGFSDQLLGSLEGKKLGPDDLPSSPIDQPPGGESLQKFRERVLATMSEARQSSENTLLVTHRRVAQVLVQTDPGLRPGVLYEFQWDADSSDLPLVRVVSFP